MKERKKLRRTVSAEGLARKLNLSDRRVRQLAQGGVFPRVRRGRYDVEECTTAYKSFLRSSGRLNPNTQTVDERGERTLLIRAQRENREMENALKRGRLIPIELVGQELEKAALVFRQAMLRIPLIAPELEGQSIAEIRARLTAAVHRALGKISMIENPKGETNADAKARGDVEGNFAALDARLPDGHD